MKRRFLPIALFLTFCCWQQVFAQVIPYVKGKRYYEMVNHLGNVNVVVSNLRIQVDEDADGIAEAFEADVRSATDYDAYGMIMPRRHLPTHPYLFSFNGVEKEDEIAGEGTVLHFDQRSYHAKIGRFLSVDPIFLHYPDLSAYQFASLSPIQAIDLEGLEGFRVIVKFAGGTKLNDSNISMDPAIPTGETRIVKELYEGQNPKSTPYMTKYRKVKDYETPVTTKVTKKTINHEVNLLSTASNFSQWNQSSNQVAANIGIIIGQQVEMGGRAGEGFRKSFFGENVIERPTVVETIEGVDFDVSTTETQFGEGTWEQSRFSHFHVTILAFEKNKNVESIISNLRQQGYSASFQKSPPGAIHSIQNKATTQGINEGINVKVSYKEEKTEHVKSKTKTTYRPRPD